MQALQCASRCAYCLQAKTVAVEAGALQLLVSVIQHYSEDHAGVCEDCCNVLSSLVLNSTPHQEEVRQRRCPVVIDASPFIAYSLFSAAAAPGGSPSDSGRDGVAPHLRIAASCGLPPPSQPHRVQSPFSLT